jgi:hypothetical protein
MAVIAAARPRVSNPGKPLFRALRSQSKLAFILIEAVNEFLW